MNKKLIALLSALLIWPVLSILLQGCTSDKAFTRKNTSESSSLKVVRQKTPGILRSNETESALFTTAAIALPGGSALMMIGDDFARTKGEKMQMKIPDFGYLVMHKFIEKLHNGKQVWPELIVEDAPVESGRIYTETSMEFKVERLAYGHLGFIRGGGSGLFSKTSVTMKDSKGGILWQKTFTYKSKDFSRENDLNALEAEDGKLLKEELEFAIEKTVSAFLEDLNKEKQVASN